MLILLFFVLVLFRVLGRNYDSVAIQAVLNFIN